MKIEKAPFPVVVPHKEMVGILRRARQAEVEEAREQLRARVEEYRAQKYARAGGL